jgi:hypothetical protein
MHGLQWDYFFPRSPQGDWLLMDCCKYVAGSSRDLFYNSVLETDAKDSRNHENKQSQQQESVGELISFISF